MLIAILIISILNLLLVILLSGMNTKITNMETTLDEIKDKTDKLGTFNYK